MNIRSSRPARADDGVDGGLHRGRVGDVEGVLAVCPGAVETPILDKGAVGGFVGRDYYLRGQGLKSAYSADRLANDTLKAIARNKALLVKPNQSYASWVFARLAPTLLQRMSIRFVTKQRKRQGARFSA